MKKEDKYFAPPSLEAAQALHDKYTEMLNRIFKGAVVMDAPFDDPKFWQLFQARITHLRSLEGDAMRWSAMKDLAREIGKAMKP